MKLYKVDWLPQEEVWLEICEIDMVPDCSEYRVFSYAVHFDLESCGWNWILFFCVDVHVRTCQLFYLCVFARLSEVWKQKNDSYWTMSSRCWTESGIGGSVEGVKVLMFNFLILKISSQFCTKRSIHSFNLRNTTHLRIY